MNNKSAIDLRGRFTFLDGLRGLAALSVACFHYFNHWVSPIHDQLAILLPAFVQRILEHADMGVEVFFVLSGFVIAHSLYGKRITLAFGGNFILRRSLRLDPPYWIVLVVSIGLPYLTMPTLVHGFFTKFGGPSGFLINMFYLPDLLWRPRIVGVAWTLCLEVQFYLAYLLLLGLMQTIIATGWNKTSTALIGFVFGLIAAYSLYRWFSQGKNTFGGRWFMFFSGALLYWTLRNRVSRRVLAVYLSTIAVLSVWFAEPRSAIILLTVLAIYVAAVSGNLQRWLSATGVQYLGRISYSFYLVHMPIGVAAIAAVMKHTSGTPIDVVLAFFAAIVAAILVAELLYRVAEAPAIALSKRFRPSSDHPAPSVIDPPAENDTALLCASSL